MTTSRGARERATVLTCVEGPLTGMGLVAREGDHRPVWYVPPPKTGVSYTTYRASRFELLPPGARQRATGCYVRSPRDPQVLIWLAWK